jgi:acyl-CoA thioester hydrolase
VVRPKGAVDGYRLAVPIEVRFKDIDLMGHVNNAVYFTYFENARIAYWRALGRNRLRGDVAYVLARAECDFRTPATMEDDLRCHIRLAALGRTSFGFDYLLRDERSGRTVAEGRTVQVSYDYAAGRPVPLPQRLKAIARRFEGRSIGAHRPRSPRPARRATRGARRPATGR